MGGANREDVPAFLREQLEPLDDDALHSVAEYARRPDGVPDESVPRTVVNAVVMQDESEQEAIASYAERLAAGATDEESEPSGEESGSDGGNDDVPSMGPFFG
jgi:hypothetical protein